MNTTGVRIIIDTKSSDSVYLVSNDRHFNKLKEIDFPKINLYSLAEFESEFKVE